MENEIIELRCKQCKQRLMDYTLTDKDETIVLQHITMKCCRCKRVMILKKHTEGMLRVHAVNNTYRI